MCAFVKLRLLGAFVTTTRVLGLTKEADQPCPHWRPLANAAKQTVLGGDATFF